MIPFSQRNLTLERKKDKKEMENCMEVNSPSTKWVKLTFVNETEAADFAASCEHPVKTKVDGKIVEITIG